MNWITIETYAFIHEGYIAQTKLENEGIPTFLKDEVSTQILNAVGGVQLQVHEEDAQKAINILENIITE